MAITPLGPDLEPIVEIAHQRGDNKILTALLQIHSSRRGDCALEDCGDCPLGVSGCLASDRDTRAATFFARHYLQKKIA